MSDTYPGMPHHQALLACIVHHYRDDPRILAVCLFGSLVRGNFDTYSDLDLDVVLKDDVQVNVIVELENLCTAFNPLGEYPLLLMPDGSDAGNGVLASLTGFSIRYHTLATTSPNIVDSLKVLTGALDLEAIKVAGRANQKPPRSAGQHDVDSFLRHAVEVHIMLRRKRFWLAEHLLQRMRQTLIEIFAFSRGEIRPFHAFDTQADETLKAELGRLLPRYEQSSLRETLAGMLDFLEHRLETLSNGQLHLTEKQREAMAKIRQRLEKRESS